MAMWSVTQTSAIAGAASAARAQASTVSRVDCGPMLRSTMPTRMRRPSRCAPPLSMVERRWMTSPAHAPVEPLRRPRAVHGAAPPRRSHVGTISLLAAVAGVVITRVVLATTSLADAAWLHVVAAGFEEVVGFVDRVAQRQLRDLPVDASTGAWLARAVTSKGAGAAFESLALSFSNLAARPRTAAELHWWLERSAGALHASGKRFLPFVLRRKVVQRAIVEAACDYASAELRSAARDPEHPLRRAVLTALRRFAERLAAGDADAQAQAERLRRALLESIQAGPVVRTMLGRVREQLEQDLGDRRSALSTLIDRQLRTGILDLLADAGRRSAFDRWVRTTASDLLRRHHSQIGLTVRESLAGLGDDELVRQIEDRVGADLQFIRLNGAVVGGLVGLILALIHRLAGRGFPRKGAAT